MLALATLVGCASAPSLGDARLEDVRLATPSDDQEQAAADAELDRSLFGGATINDARLGTRTYARNDYDRFLSDYPTGSRLFRPSPLPWPRLRIGFSTRRELINPESTTTVYTAELIATFCESGRRIYGSTILWNGLYLTGQAALRASALLASSPEPLTYQVIIPYVVYGPGSRPRSVLLQSPVEDVCLAMSVQNWPWASHTGRPLRIPRTVISNALGPLPRELRADDR